MKYPESFKVRFSDNVSRPADCTWLEGLCRDLKIKQLHEVMKKIQLGKGELKRKEDFEVLIKFFAKDNTSAFLNEWPVVLDKVNGTAKYLWDHEGKLPRHYKGGMGGAIISKRYERNKIVNKFYAGYPHKDSGTPCTSTILFI